MSWLPVLMVVLILAAPAAAQEPARLPQTGPAPAPQINTVDVDRLPINIARIQKELQVEVREERDGLNLRYHLRIFGQAPPLTFFTPEDNLATGPVPYGAPTHQEILDHITPREFRSPVMDFSNLIRWLADRAKKEKDPERR